MEASSLRRFANRSVLLSLLTAGAAWLDWPMVATADTIRVINGSFETPRSRVGDWAYIDTSWSVHTEYLYSQTRTTSTAHFSAAARGSWFVHLTAPVSITQNLSTAVSAGDVLSVTFSGGRAKDSSSTAGGGVIDATFLVGSTPYTASFDTATQGADTWQSYTLTKTNANSGNLSLVFSWVSGKPWLDNVGSVTLTKARCDVIPVSNSSFETPGTLAPGNYWAYVGTPWIAADSTSVYQQNKSHTAVPSNSLFTDPADGQTGDWSAYLAGMGATLTQDLSTTVSSGQTLSVTFYGGRAKDVSLVPGGGTFNVAFKVGDTTYTIDSPIDTTGLPQDTWQRYTLTKTIANSGNLSLVFSVVSGHPGLDLIGDVMASRLPRGMVAIIK